MPERVIIAAAKTVGVALRTTEKLWGRGGPLLPVIFKGLLFGVLLFGVQRSGFAGWPVFFLLLVALVSYVQPVFRTFSFGTSLLLTLSLSLLLTSRFTIALPGAEGTGMFGQFVFSAVFGFLFFVLLGIKNFVLVNRKQWYSLIFVALFYGVSMLFFTSISGSTPWRDVLLLGFFIYLLLREYFITQEHPKNRGLLIITLCITLMLVELAWALSVLPLGFSKAASALTLIGMVASGVTERYLTGALTARFIRLTVSLVLVLIGILFLSAQWTL